ncbi:divergent polysaccharide deacetylase family protein [Fundidesulfovibrio putealis]|uniref:divergent polysaccharide deacetylase family protein n=1 Tax=Fundidesulfovibrio putealis TaxID=270496 RepID=UPI00040E7968|nr:divergent polysaccharide deacetylase family protein [Fundidesulfovibrio putealis]
MPKKSPGKPRRRPAKSQRGRKDTPAALVFFAGVAVAAIILFFGYAFFYLPDQKAPKTPTAQTKAPAPAAPAAPAPGTPAPAPTPEKPAASPDTPPTAPAATAPATPAQPEPPLKAGSPRLTIVIDDLGGSLEQARDLLDLGLPVTFSIMPNLPHTKDVDAMAAKAGMEVILHQPMDAHGSAPQAAGTLRTGMTVPETAAILAAHLAQAPHAVGVSNHTGSKATEDAVLMAAVMADLKGRGLFFLDSLTSAKSVAGKEAAKAQVPTLSRTVFLDNERGQQPTLLMLAQAEKEARAKGRAVAIGHPYPETIAALAAWDIRRDKSIALVTLSRQLKGN